METYLKQYLYTLYSQEEFKDRIHLDGGVALKFFYNIDRKFSNDLDFTIEDNGSANLLIDFIISYFQGYIDHSVQTSENKILILRNNTHLFHIDYYIVPAEYCNYSSEMLELEGKPQLPCSIHSIEDILVEKLFCLVSRTEKRDMTDIVSILDIRINLSVIDELIVFKNGIKKVEGMSGLKSFLEWFLETGKKRFSERYDDLGATLQCIETKLKESSKT